MSDLITPSPYPIDSPEYDQYVKGILQGGKAAAIAVPKAATHLVPGFISSLLSSPNARGLEVAIPNGANGLYSAIDLLYNLGNRALGNGPDAHLPGGVRAGELYDNRLAPGSVASLIPAAKADTPFEAAMNEMGSAAGSMGPYAGAGALRSVPLLPRLAAEAVLPGLTAPSAPAVAGVLSGVADATLGGSEAHADASVPPTTPVPTAPVDANTLPIPPIPPTQQPPQQLQTVPLNTTAEFIPTPPIVEGNTPLTWGMLAAGGAGVLALLATHGKIGEFISNKVRGTRQALYEAESAPYNAQRNLIANADPSVLSGVDELKAPLPNNAEGIGTRTKTAVFDKNELLNKVTDYTSPTPTAAQEMRAQTGILNNDQAFHSRFSHFTETGIDPVSGVRMPSPVKHFQRVASLTEDQRQIYNDARHAANELDNRLLTPTKNRVNYSGYDDATLQARISAGMNDPAVAAAINEANNIHRAVADLLQQRGMITAAENAKFQRMHPNYMSSYDLQGIIENPLASRNLAAETGPRTIGVNAWDIDKQHLEAIMRAVEKNDFARNIVNNILDFQNNNRRNAQILEQWKRPINSTDARVPDDVITIRNNGVLQHYRVHNPALKFALEQSPMQMGVLGDNMNKLRQFVQFNVTGPGALIGGKFFPPINAIRNTIEGAAIRPRGFAGGYIDKALQRATNGKMALRGDPTALITMPREWLSSISALVSKHIAKALDPLQANGYNPLLRNLLGNDVVNAIHTRMQAAWENSIAAEMRKYGAANSGGYSSVSVPTNYIGDNQRVFSTLNNQVPELFRANRTFGGLEPFGVRLNELMKEIWSLIGDAGHQQFYRLNKNNPAISRNRLVFETRQLTGDPGTSGASKGIRTFTSTAPYANIALQEISRLSRAFSEAPFSTTIGLIGAITPLVMAELYTAMLHGPDALQHIDNMSSSDAATNLHFFVPGEDPQNAASISLPQGLRVFLPVIRQALFDGLGVINAHSDDPTATMLWNGFNDFFAKHVTTTTSDAARMGLSQFVSPPMPVALDVATILSGRNLDPTLDRAVENFPNVQRMISNDLGQAGPRLPGTQQVDPLFESESGKVFQQLVSTLTGIAGQSILQSVLTTKNAMRDTNDPLYALNNVLEDYSIKLNNQLAIGNGILWDANNKLTTQTPLIVRTNEALNAMKPLTTFRNDIVSAGMTRAKGLPVANYADPKVTTDPNMQPLIGLVGKTASLINTKFMPSIEDTKKQMATLAYSSLPPKVVMDMRNQYTKQLYEQYAQVATIITDMNHTLSNMVGRPTDVTQIDFHKGIEQFSQ